MSDFKKYMAFIIYYYYSLENTCVQCWEKWMVAMSQK